ncbi:type III pantothenate kinase [Candidatus Methylospira mobilis]|nr:type III pantothenate kinase [Candidatus Methylospira mobilis]
MTADRILLLDAGNSRIKWGFAREGQQIEAGKAIPARLPFSHALLDRHWGELARPSAVALASVAARRIDDAVIAWVAERWRLEVRRISACKQMSGVINGYEDPSALGVDRWLGLLAAHRLSPASPACVADCGTAITLDWLDADGKHRGGVIAPGLNMMRTALAQGADRLSMAHHGSHQGPGKTTADAIAAGVSGAAIGLIEHFMQQYGRDCALFLTGGDAPHIAAGLNLPHRLEPNLVLMGLSIAVSDAT